MIFAQNRIGRASNPQSGEGLRSAPLRTAQSCYAGVSALVASRVNTQTDS